MEADELLHTFTFTVSAVMYLYRNNPPFVVGAHPVVPLGSALKSAVTLSVVSAPVAVAVCAAVQVPEEIAPVPSVKVPFATMIGTLVATILESAGMFAAPKLTKCPLVPANAV